jgi:hypothetical protein
MVFIRPKILRDGVQTAIETNAKYNFIREQQRKAGANPGEILPLIPFNKDPLLPPMPPPDTARDKGTDATVKPPSGPADVPAKPKQ